MKHTVSGLIALLGFAAVPGIAQAALSFSTFVGAGAISAAESGINSTIAFAYTGTGFVGSVYVGPTNNQLYSTDLSGGNVAPYGQPIPDFSSEVVLGVGLGKGGFAAGTVYAGNGADGTIYRVPASGVPTLFASLPDELNIRQIFMDPGTTFGGNMLVSTSFGDIYSISSNGTVTMLATIGVDTEGMDIASNRFGPLSGSLLVASEGSGELNAIDPITHDVTLVASGLTQAETVLTVPANACSPSSSIEGFYVANYPNNIQFASSAQFCDYVGDTIVTGEFDSNSQVVAIHWNGTSYTTTLIGTLPDQAEDGIFVTTERVIDLTSVPEPATLALFGVALPGLACAVRRRT